VDRKDFIWGAVPSIPRSFLQVVVVNTTKVNKNILEVFSFIIFSLGRMEAKIMNAIKIPPVKRMKKIRGIQTDPVFVLTRRNIIDDPSKIENLIFIGLLELVINRILIMVIILKPKVIIFLSLRLKF
jgi:hypothetical protein